MLPNILYIDHGNKNNNLKVLDGLDCKVYITKYKTSYLNTLRGWLANNLEILDSDSPLMWITSSVCDYKNFNFGLQVDPDKTEQLNVFSSAHNDRIQKFGDTFFVDVFKFKNYATGLDRLENYPGYINYIEDITVDRLPHPIFTHDNDSHLPVFSAALEQNFPYVEIQNTNYIGSAEHILINLWYNSEAQISVGSTGATNIIVPLSAANKLVDKKEIYDWPYIYINSKLGHSRPLDIIFISNGEPCAQENYDHLLDVLANSSAPNSVTWVKDVNGRVASQHVAAKLSNTSWYFLINAKLKVDPGFDWGWQPDRLQMPKHYIFMAKNPVNDLIYGHQAIVANNKLLTLQTNMSGLDFTMDSPHAVVDLLSGVSMYNIDPWTTWRTAFRESVKLINAGDTESMIRLEAWTGVGNGHYGEWSIKGACDGVEYWHSVGGSMELLLLSYDWNWLNSYYKKKYNL